MGGLLCRWVCLWNKTISFFSIKSLLFSPHKYLNWIENRLTWANRYLSTCAGVDIDYISLYTMIHYTIHNYVFFGQGNSFLNVLNTKFTLLHVDLNKIKLIIITIILYRRYPYVKKIKKFKISIFRIKTTEKATKFELALN